MFLKKKSDKGTTCVNISSLSIIKYVNNKDAWGMILDTPSDSSR